MHKNTWLKHTESNSVAEQEVFPFRGFVWIICVNVCHMSGCLQRKGFCFPNQTYGRHANSDGKKNWETAHSVMPVFMNRSHRPLSATSQSQTWLRKCQENIQLAVPVSHSTCAKEWMNYLESGREMKKNTKWKWKTQRLCKISPCLSNLWLICTPEHIHT